MNFDNSKLAYFNSQSEVALENSRRFASLKLVSLRNRLI